MTATVSSIHINAWFGDHNKWHGAQWILKELKHLPTYMAQQEHGAGFAEVASLLSSIL